MIKQYFNQTIKQLREYPLISLITVIGTSFAIFLIMLVVMINNITLLPFSPESNRDRFLHVLHMSVNDIGSSDDGYSGSTGPMSLKCINELFKSLKTPEVVTTYSVYNIKIVASMPGQKLINVEMRETDAEYFKVFDYRFIDGKPYTKADVESHIPLTVITESVSRSLFGTTDGVVGKSILLNYSPCKVVGVVKDVSILANNGFSQVWVPYGTITLASESSWENGVMGSFGVTILAKKRSDFPEIRQECNKKFDEFNKAMSSTGRKLVPRNKPYDQEKVSVRASSNAEPDVKRDRILKSTIYVILLLVPAINLASMTHSRLRQRVVEIGVRRAFGCTKLQLLIQIIMENFIITLLSGLLGFIMCLIFAKTMSADFFALQWNPSMVTPEVDSSMLFQPKVFLYALMFCFILNLLSCGIPAWRASRSNVVDSLGGIIK